MLAIGSIFLYGENGVCRLEAVRNESFRGSAARDYYILRPVFNETSTLYVPTDSEVLRRKMRPMLTPEEANKLVESIPALETDWIADDKMRAEHFRRVLSACDPRELLRMLKTIYRRRRELMAKGRRLHSADEMLWHSAEKIVREEMAYVLGLPLDTALSTLFAADCA